MPDKVNEFYVAGRELYLKQMDGVISRVADIVGQRPHRRQATDRQGPRRDRGVRQDAVRPTCRRWGRRPRRRSATGSNDLESDVNDKQNALVENLASKYVEARKGLDERIEALQAENKGLVDKAIGAIKAVINTIRELAVDAARTCWPARHP